MMQALQQLCQRIAAERRCSAPVDQKNGGERFAHSAQAETLPELQIDSRSVCVGDIFVALPPATAQRQLPSAAYLNAALEAGAQILIVPADMDISAPHEKYADRTWILVKDTRKALGLLAQARFDTENLPFPVIALTGTNGKTTSAYLLEHLYEACGKKVGVLGTVSYRWPGHCQDAPLTTPDCLTIHAALQAMKQAGAEAAIMEVSSHAIDQERVAGIRFAGALFTNLTQDHLDYHGTMENYFAAKARLFTEFPNKDKALSINIADPYGARLLAECAALHAADKTSGKSEICPSAIEKETHGIGFNVSFAAHDHAAAPNILHAVIVRSDTDGLLLEHHYQGKTWTLSSPLVGEHNAYNLAGVEALALQLGFSVEDLQHLSDFYGVPGRLERIPVPALLPNLPNDMQKKGAGTGIFVDYAHTPDALVHALDALKKAGFSRLITVFGCGGDRDRTKRPLMGKAVAEVSDIVVLTSDNPRTEDPEAIMDDIMPGLQQAREVHRNGDRRQALALAVSLLRPGDALLVAGKGHEPYQIIGKTKYPFSDQKILKELLA